MNGKSRSVCIILEQRAKEFIALGKYLSTVVAHFKRIQKSMILISDGDGKKEVAISMAQYHVLGLCLSPTIDEKSHIRHNSCN